MASVTQISYLIENQIDLGEANGRPYPEVHLIFNLMFRGSYNLPSFPREYWSGTWVCRLGKL